MTRINPAKACNAVETATDALKHGHGKYYAADIGTTEAFITAQINAWGQQWAESPDPKCRPSAADIAAKRAEIARRIAEHAAEIAEENEAAAADPNNAWK